jgi:hypothetical protein
MTSIDASQVQDDLQPSTCVRNCSPSRDRLSSVPGSAPSFTVIDSLNDAPNRQSAGGARDVCTHIHTHKRTHHTPHTTQMPENRTSGGVFSGLFELNGQMLKSCMIGKLPAEPF